MQIAVVDNILRDLHNSSHHTKAEFNNCFIIHSKYIKVLITSLHSRRPSLKVWPISRYCFRILQGTAWPCG